MSSIAGAAVMIAAACLIVLGDPSGDQTGFLFVMGIFGLLALIGVFD